MAGSTKILITLFSFGMIVVSFIIGWWAKKKATTAQAYFGSTGLFGPFVVGFSSMAAVASAFALVGVPGIIYSTGNAMTFWMLSSGAFPMAYIILGKKVRAMAEVGPVASLGDISDLRFNNNKGIKVLMSLIIFIGCIAYLASQIKAGSELFGHLLGLNPILAGFLIFGVLTIYTALSGEVGGALTQAFQGLVMVIAGFIMIIAFFKVTGGFRSVLEVAATAGAVTSGEVGKAVISLKPGMMISKENIISRLKKQLASYKVPKYIQFIEEIPKNNVGKIEISTVVKLYGTIDE
ncbi:sodium:solute symporter family transporter [Clostridium sp. Cult2]|uniref:sodium:solute symporter family transporter n=1 Tax=Clostridium sp. Cult2 TaxID=2079003 RepID=UPI001F24A81F|nr:hypothetical protein [Clostridium sp. Cult2]MCF6466134.1 hypothetical protein [Clostridium sp. Cult2]